MGSAIDRRVAALAAAAAALAKGGGGGPSQAPQPHPRSAPPLVVGTPNRTDHSAALQPGEGH
eukprot:SAG31_NODE_293_length_18292_cov_8.779586_1_plen_62_part_00